MNELKNTHPGEILKDFLVDYNLSQNKLAMELRVPVRRINAIIKEERGITADTAVRLSKFFGNSAQFWLNLQETYDIVKAEDELSTELKKITVMMLTVMVVLTMTGCCTTFSKKTSNVCFETENKTESDQVTVVVTNAWNNEIIHEGKSGDLVELKNGYSNSKTYKPQRGYYHAFFFKPGYTPVEVALGGKIRSLAYWNAIFFIPFLNLGWDIDKDSGCLWYLEPRIVCKFDKVNEKTKNITAEQMKSVFLVGYKKNLVEFRKKKEIELKAWTRRRCEAILKSMNIPGLVEGDPNGSKYEQRLSKLKTTREIFSFANKFRIGTPIRVKALVKICLILNGRDAVMDFFNSYSFSEKFIIKGELIQTGEKVFGGAGREYESMGTHFTQSSIIAIGLF
jgi:antitoxin HigA-1